MQNNPNQFYSIAPNPALAYQQQMSQYAQLSQPAIPASYHPAVAPNPFQTNPYSYMPSLQQYLPAPMNYQYQNHNLHPPQQPLHPQQPQQQSPSLKRKAPSDTDTNIQQPPAKKPRPSPSPSDNKQDDDSDSDEAGKMSLHQVLSQQMSQQQSDFNNPYKIGQAVKVKEKDCPMKLDANIIDIGHDWIKVHYVGFEDEFDAKIYVDPTHKNFKKHKVIASDQAAPIKPDPVKPENEEKHDNDKEEMDVDDTNDNEQGNDEKERNQIKMEESEKQKQAEIKKQILFESLGNMVAEKRRQLNKKEYDKVLDDIKKYLDNGMDKELLKKEKPDLLGELYCIYSICLGQLGEYDEGIKECKEKQTEALEQFNMALKQQMPEDKRRVIQQRRDNILKDINESKHANANNNHNQHNQASNDDHDVHDNEANQDSDHQPILRQSQRQRNRRVPQRAATPPSSDSSDSDSSSDESSDDEDIDVPMNDRDRNRNSNSNRNRNRSNYNNGIKGKGVKGTTLDQRIMDTSLMSVVQKKAYDARHRNENGFYYRFNLEGESQANGAWTSAEHKKFMERVLEWGVNHKWGLWSIPINGRVGYQCSNYWRKLQEDGWVYDENYKDDAKGKKKQLKKREIDAKGNGTKDFFDRFRKYQFTVIKDPSGTFRNLPCKHPKAPIISRGDNVMRIKREEDDEEGSDGNHGRHRGSRESGRRGRGRGRGGGRNNNVDKWERKRIKQEEKRIKQEEKRRKNEEKQRRKEEKLRQKQEREERNRIKREEQQKRRMERDRRQNLKRERRDRSHSRHEVIKREPLRRSMRRQQQRDRERRDRDRDRRRGRDRYRERGRGRRGGRRRVKYEDEDDESDYFVVDGEQEFSSDSDYHEEEEKDSEEEEECETTDNRVKEEKVKEEEQDDNDDEDENEKEPPKEFMCPISYELMEDPVMVRQSGWTYERAEIVSWINENGNDPNTRDECKLTDLIPNRTLRDAILSWKEEVGYIKSED